MAEKDAAKDLSGSAKYQPPKKRAGGDGSSEEGGSIVVRPVQRATNVPVQYPQLTESNYQLWATKMKIIMRPMGVWSAVEGDVEFDEEKDQGAMAAISQSVPDDVMMILAEYETAREAWAAIRMMRVGEDRVVQARIQSLLRRLDRLTMADGEDVSSFSRRLTTLVGEIRSLGEKVTERTIVQRLFAAMPRHFSQIIGTIEQWADMRKMTVVEAVGRLRTFEENESGRYDGRGGKDDQLLLMTKALESFFQKKKGSPGAGGSGSKGKPNQGQCPGNSAAGGSGSGGGKKGNNNGGKQKKHRKFDITKVKCWNCEKMGHFSSDCPEPKRERAHLAANDEEDEPGLLMAEVCDLVIASDKGGEQVLLNEERVIPKLTGEQNLSWYLDTGASNHMT
uniref:CCHC-type domain-containing protein n=1 Tax=Aegilops tauschii subsp. strangulata TaxID=200361 RepID=A0A453TF16_AEGTS